MGMIRAHLSASREILVYFIPHCKGAIPPLLLVHNNLDRRLGTALGNVWAVW